MVDLRMVWYLELVTSLHLLHSPAFCFFRFGRAIDHFHSIGVITILAIHHGEMGAMNSINYKIIWMWTFPRWGGQQRLSFALFSPQWVGDDAVVERGGSIQTHPKNSTPQHPTLPRIRESLSWWEKCRHFHICWLCALSYMINCYCHLFCALGILGWIRAGRSFLRRWRRPQMDSHW